MLILLLPMLAAATPPEPTDADAVAFMAWIDRMDAAASALKDATWTLHQQEYAGGSLQPITKTEVKFRADGAVYMRWTGDITPGRELLYVPGWNEDRMRVKVGNYVPNVNLAIDSRMATRNQRHTVAEVSVIKTVALIVSGSRRIAASDSWSPKVTRTEQTRLHGEAVECFETWAPKDEDPSFYARRVDLCLSPRTSLPARVVAWDIEDGELRMVEDYTFEALVVNPGLPASAFTPEHDGYGF